MDSASIHVTRIVYRPIPNDAVRYTTLQAGAVGFVERLSPTDALDARADPRLAVRVYDGLEAGFAVKVQASEFASALQAETRGDFQGTAIGWSGRVDPDGNLYNGLTSNGPLNATHYANKDVDTWLDQTRLTSDLGERRALYAKITDQIAADMPVKYLYSTAMVMGMTSHLQGFRAVPDGLIRVQGLLLN